MIPDDYFVTMGGAQTSMYGVICAIVRAPDEETAIDKMKQAYPIDFGNPPTITAKLLDHILSGSDDVIELVDYRE